jgi:exo-1,4-beta-D-glucosaminidase
MRFTRRPPRTRVTARTAAIAAAAALLAGVPAQPAPASQASQTSMASQVSQVSQASMAAAAVPGQQRTAEPGPAVAALIAQAETAVASPSDTGASNLANLGTAGWRVASSVTATQSGKAISQPGFDASTWLPVTNDDAGAPGTEIEALLQNGVCPGDPDLHVNQASAGPRSVFYAANMKACFGYMGRIGAVTVPRFAVPWWWRTDFRPRMRPGSSTAQLVVNGIVGAAAVWVNGHQVATPATVTVAYTRLSFDITRLLRRGTNTVAIEVQPNNPSKMFTVDDVDWNQIPPDNNTGIQFPVQLQAGGPPTATRTSSSTTRPA